MTHAVLINAHLYVVHNGLSVASRGGATYVGLVRPLDITVCGKDRQLVGNCIY